MKYGKLFGLIIIFLIVFTVPCSLYANEDINARDLMIDTIKDSLDTEVDNGTVDGLNDTDDNSTDYAFNNTPDAIIKNHIIKLAPHITNGELNAIFTTMRDQFYNVDHDTNTIIDLYCAYANNSTSFPIKGVSFTAQELYDQKNNYYGSIIKSIDRIIDDYDHMSREEKYDFLITRDTNLKNALECFKTNDKNKIIVLTNAISNISFPEFNDDKRYDIETLKDYANSVSAFSNKFCNAVYKADTAYDLDFADGLNYNSLNNNTIYNYDFSQISIALIKITNHRDNAGALAMSCLIGGIVCLAITPMSERYLFKKLFIHTMMVPGCEISLKAFARIEDDLGSYTRLIKDVKSAIVAPAGMFFNIMKLIYFTVVVILLAIGLALLSLSIYFFVVTYGYLQPLIDLLENLKEEVKT